MKNAKTLFANLKISSKIWFCMLSIVVVLCLFIGILSSRYFSRLYEEDSYAQASDALQIGSQSLGDSYHTLLLSVIDFAASPTCTSILQNSKSGNYYQNRPNTDDIQKAFASIVLSNPLLDSMMIIEKNGNFYSLFSNALRKDADPVSYFGWDLTIADNITWLPACQSPYIKGNVIVPVIVPITGTYSQYLTPAITDYEHADMFIILLLNNRQITKKLALANSDYSDRILYITDQYGSNLTLTPDSGFYDIATSPETAQLIHASNEKSLDDSIQFLLDERDYTLYGTNLSYSKLKIICLQPKDQLYERIHTTNVFLCVIALAGLAIATLMAFQLSRFITRPLDQLIKNVKNIENNTYDTPYQTKYQDEIGHLNQAINSMYGTIQMQFQQIRESERAKYRAEIQLLSEQINPHFLYNTLECINMEMQGGHKEEAAAMITCLGDFLRIGLSYGNEIIPISKELTHVKAYVDIMNYRFNQKIDLKIDLSPELNQMYILKSILQPLAENAIRHGFDTNNALYHNILMPAIEIHIFRRESDGDSRELILEVVDNGHGIDIAKATRALTDESSGGRRHVGLCNVYKRLNSCYGDVKIEFETIPYFRNTVRVVILRCPDYDSTSL